MINKLSIKTINYLSNDKMLDLFTMLGQNTLRYKMNTSNVFTPTIETIPANETVLHNEIFQDVKRFQSVHPDNGRKANNKNTRK